MYLIILVASLLLSPLAATRFANQIYIERAVPFLSTAALVKYAKSCENDSFKGFVMWLAQFCDCYWCASFIAALFVILFMSWTPLRLVIILYGISEAAILINTHLHKG